MKIVNAIRYYKQHGVLYLLKRIFVSFGFEFFEHTFIFIILDMNDIQDDIKKPYSFYEVAVADVQQAEHYNDGWFSKKESISRLQDGHRLFVLKNNEKMIYCLWGQIKKITINWLDINLNIPESMICITGGYTLPEYRGKGIASKLKKEIFHKFKKEGYHHILGFVDPSNFTALKIDKKLCFKEYQ